MATALAVCGAAAASGQQAGLLVLEAPGGTESMAYGGAPWLFTTGADVLFENPGLLGRAEGVAASLQSYGGEGTLVSLAGAGELQGGGFAAGVQILRYGTEPGLPQARDRQSAALTPGSVGVTELVGTVGYGRRWLGLEIGAAFKYLDQSLDDDRDEVVAFDLGAARQIGPLAVGIALRDLGSDLRLDDLDEASTAGSTRRELPTRIVADVSTESFEVGELDLFLASRVTRRRDGEIVPAGGVELSYWPVTGYTFRLRAGLQRVVEDARSPITLGAAFTGDHITLEYAFQSFDGEGDAHRFGLRWR